MGQATTMTDPNGTKHTHTYDVVGRPIIDAITVLGAGVDGAVRRFQTEYDGGGRPYRFTSAAATNGSTTVNQVTDTFNGLGQVTTEYQEHSGTVSTSTSARVNYGYTAMSGGQNNSRPTTLTYPNGRVVDYVYNAGLDTTISRVSALADDVAGSPGTSLEAYTYLSLGTIVERNRPETGVNLTYIQQAGDTAANTTGGDRYTGLDRFGRVIDQNWLKTSAGTSADRHQYGYDRVGNALYQADLVDTALSEPYHPNSASSGDNNTAYDPQGRLRGFSRGVLTASGNNGTTGLDTVATPGASQSWSLDALGNWAGITTNGTAVTRGFNAQNQATSVSGASAPTFDQDGNTKTDNGLSYVYDAWNRLVSVSSGATTLATYSYDALGRRIVESYPAAATTNHLYYSLAGQVLEERRNGTAASNISQQYVWSESYVNALVLRDIYSVGVRTQRLYALQDANFDTTALVDATSAVQERYVYDPYGSVTVLDAGGNPRAGNASSFGWQYLFQGGRQDPVTGWYLFGARDLISTEGRWAQRDPIGFAGGDTNLYRFVGNDPLNSVDPTGLSAWDFVQQAWDIRVAFDAGLNQGAAYVLNSVTDVGVGLVNVPARIWNNTAVGLIPGAGLRDYYTWDWSTDLFTQEASEQRSINRGASNVAVAVGSLLIPGGQTKALGYIGSGLKAGGSLLTAGGAVVSRASAIVSTSEGVIAIPTGWAIVPSLAGMLNQYSTGGSPAASCPGPYSHIPDKLKVEPGRPFQPQQKAKILEANRQKNGGKLMSDDPADPWFGKELKGPGPRRFAGDSVPPDEAQIDHIIPRIGPDGKPPGTNSYSNARVISAEYNNFLRNKK